MLLINLFYYTTVLQCSNNLYTSEIVTNIAKDQREKRNFLVQHSTWSEMLVNCKDDQFCNELDQLQIHAIKTPQYSTFIEEFEKTIQMDKLKSIMNNLTGDILIQKQALYADIKLKEYITIANQFMFRSLVLNFLLTTFEQMNIYNESIEYELLVICQQLPLDKSCKSEDEIKTYNDELLKVIIKLYEMYLVFLDNFEKMYYQLKSAYKSLEDGEQLAYTYQDSLFVNKVNLWSIYTNIDYLATKISHYKCEHIQNLHDSYSSSQFDVKNFLDTQLIFFTRKASVLNSFVKLLKDHLDAFTITGELDDSLITKFLEFEMAFISVFLKDLSCFNFKINTSTENAEMTLLVDQTKLKEVHDSINAIGTGICQLTLDLFKAYRKQKK